MTRRETVYHHLNRLRGDYRRSRAILFSFATVCAALALLVAFVLTDLAFHLHPVLCWTAWVAFIGLMAGGGWVVYHAYTHEVSNSAMAVLIEKVLPNLDNHLINAVQFSEMSPAADGFVEHVLNETDVHVEHVEARHLYSQRPAKRIRIGIGACVAILALMFLCSPRGFSHATLRLLAPMAGIEPFTLTRIVRVAPGNTAVLRGDDVEITVQLEGVLPETPVVIWERGRGNAEEVAMRPADPGTETRPAAAAGTVYTARLKGVFYESAYRVAGGDVKSPRYRIEVTNPPGLETWTAKILPPDYTGRESYSLDSSNSDLSVPVGSTIVFGGVADCELRTVRISQEDILLAEQELAGRKRFAVRFPLHEGGSARLYLEAASGLNSTITLPFVMLLDQKPSVVLVDTNQRIVAERDANVPIGFRAEDDYGVKRVGLERILGEGNLEEVTFATPREPGTTFPGRFLVELASFGVREGETLRFRVWAEDHGLNAERRRGYSAVVQISVPAIEERRTAKKQAAEQAKTNVLVLIKMQRANLQRTRMLADRAVVLSNTVPPAAIQEAHQAQQEIRTTASGLLESRGALGDLATVIAGLLNHEMTAVLETFEEAHRASRKDLPAKLSECVTLETRILAALTGIPANLGNEEKHQEKLDLFAALQKLVAAQRNNLKDSQAAQQEHAGPDVVRLLANIQDDLSNDALAFTDHCLVMIEQRVEDDFAVQLRRVYELFNEKQVYEKMLAAAEALEATDLATGIQSQEEILRVLLQALDILNIWRMNNAQRIVKEATETLKNTAEKLGELEAKQAHIAEVTRDLAKRGQLDDEVRDKLREMDEEQKDMAKMVEQLAQDLYQFPELPVCNELNSKMREVYEAVEQAMDSENTPAIEIAVQKEDSLLDAIRNTKERVEDVEMWLPDIPDNIVWNMESFDTDEFPDIPLVPLPDELEDIVGDLLDQAASIDAQSQDTTGNNIIADMEMGWAVMDGPMPSFAAKGKSGNMRPNDNEMTGRSGAGREGQATGELVENHVKGLEGRKTHARRTQDPFQKGMVTEDEDSTMDARSTGGGKLGGESETVGMFGQAPRRDLHTGDHGAIPTKLRQETEALYATARLLYLGTGSLGTAARSLRGIEEAPKKMKDFGSLHRRVMRQLEDSQVEMSSGVVLPMPVASVSKTGGAVTEEVDISQISEQYRDIVSDYYRSLGRE